MGAGIGRQTDRQAWSGAHTHSQTDRQTDRQVCSAQHREMRRQADQQTDLGCQQRAAQRQAQAGRQAALTWNTLKACGDSTGQGCAGSPDSCWVDLPRAQDMHKGRGHQAHFPMHVHHLQPAIYLMLDLHLHSHRLSPPTVMYHAALRCALGTGEPSHSSSMPCNTCCTSPSAPEQPFCG